MKQLVVRPFLGLAFVASVLAMAACGGGGGSGSGGGGGVPNVPAITPTPGGPPATNPPATSTPASGPTPQASGPVTSYTPLPGATGQQGSGAYTFDSNPRGLTVVLDGNSLTTLAQTIPPGNNTPHVAVFPQSQACTYNPLGAPSSAGSSFFVQFLQTNNGAKSLTYNQSTDTCGSINPSTITSVARAPQSSGGNVDVSDALRIMPPKLAGLPGINPNRLVVGYRTTSLAAASRTAQDLENSAGVRGSASILPSLGGVEYRSITVAPGTSVDTLAARLRAYPEVALVEPSFVRYKLDVAPTFTNDTHFNTYEQWDMYQIGAPYAWTFQKSGAPIAIIDTGFDNNNPDIKGKVTFAEKIVGGQVTSGLAAAQDTDGHGTNVSGIAAAITNNGAGFAGVGYNAPLLEFKIFPDGANASADTADEAKAIYDAVANGAKVINLSLGSAISFGVSVVEQTAVQYAIGQGVVVVAASGNDGVNSVYFPAAYDGVISVGATSLNDNNSKNPGPQNTEFVASYSNYGPSLGLVAPGGDPANNGNDDDVLHWIYNLYSTAATPPCKNPSDCKALIAGTSQATPHVAGAVALVLATNPTLTPAQVANLLYTTADNLNDPKQGHGRLDIYKALAALNNQPVNPPASGSLPGVTKISPNQFIAFAYNNSGGSVPQILNQDYPKGVPVDNNGNFRISDVPPQTVPYKIGVWYNVAGNGRATAGDYFAVTATCPTSGKCSGTTGMTVTKLTTSALP